MSNSICKILGDNIKTYRKNMGYSQEKFAELIELNVTSLSLIERGKGFATANTLEKISSVLGVSISVLMSNFEAEDEKFLFSEIQSQIDYIKKDKRKLKLLYEYLKVLN